MKICNKKNIPHMIMILLLITAFVGYWMNVQNLFQYWPNTGVLGDVEIRWVVSLIGVFIPPVGVFTGWFW